MLNDLKINTQIMRDVKHILLFLRRGRFRFLRGGGVHMRYFVCSEMGWYYVFLI